MKKARILKEIKKSPGTEIWDKVFIDKSDTVCGHQVSGYFQSFQK